MDTEAALRAGVRENPFHAGHRMVLADYLDDQGRSEEAALQRTIAEPHKEEHRAALASIVENHTDTASAHSERAVDHSYLGGFHGYHGSTSHPVYHAEDADEWATSAQARLHQTARAPGGVDYGRLAHAHEQAAEAHRKSAEAHFDRADPAGGWNEPRPHLPRHREAAELQLKAAAYHEAAAYHHRNNPDVP